MTLECFKKLSNNYLELLDEEEDFNVIINVGESPNVKIFRAHSAILKHRSLYFRDELANTDRDKSNIKTVNLKNFTIQQFEIIIKYIYGGIILLEDHDTSFIFDLMIITCEFLFEELAKHLETYLIETKASWLRLHFSNVHQKSFQNIKFQELQNWCNEIILKHPEKFFDSEDFTSIQENALISVIKRDDLQMDEVKIWKRIIEWGIAKHPDISSDPKNWSNENFLTMKTTLQNCLPFIRYFQISSENVIDHLQPYRQVLDNNLWDDIMKRLLFPNKPISSVILPPRVVLKQTLPPRTAEPFSTQTSLSRMTELFSTQTLLSKTTEQFSTIISEAHTTEITSWIDKKSNAYSVTDIPYELNLLLRGTRDGFTPTSFWNLCNKQINLVVVVRVKDTDEILGGYNPVGWDRDKPYDSRYINCDESFIFSLKNGTIQNSILSRVKKPEYAIYCHSSCGPAFGGSDLACDLAIYYGSDQCYNSPFAYEKKIRDTSNYNSLGVSYFSVDEFEIFHLTKKS